VLDQILTATAKRVAAIESRTDELLGAAAACGPCRGFAAALARDGLQVIAEIKRRSPSAGELAPRISPADQARSYAAGGAAAISVLTEPDFFAGSLADLEEVRRAVELPILRKDFIIHEVQIAEAKLAGADAILLIVAALAPDRLRTLIETAGRLGLDVLVEAHNRTELAVANATGASLVGINNRDLKTFITDLATAEGLAAEVGAAVKVAESGVSDVAGARRMAAAGYDAILVGEALVRSDDPGALVAALRRAGDSS
jgi:indole-3-glycerol phosphate synthase